MPRLAPEPSRSACCGDGPLTATHGRRRQTHLECCHGSALNGFAPASCSEEPGLDHYGSDPASPIDLSAGTGGTPATPPPPSGQRGWSPRPGCLVGSYEPCFARFRFFHEANYEPFSLTLKAGAETTSSRASETQRNEEKRQWTDASPLAKGVCRWATAHCYPITDTYSEGGMALAPVVGDFCPGASPAVAGRGPALSGPASDSPETGLHR